MRITQELWPVSRLVAEKATLNLNPAWQRGLTWKAPRQVLLIDSILRGMDVPKVYLRALQGAAHLWDVVDGQQRLRAIWAFREGDLKLKSRETLQPVSGNPVAGLVYAELHKDLRDQFDAFVISVAEILEANNDEVTSLFSRLQMGVPLNPPELRNAMLGPIRHTIDSIAMSHEFFLNCRIPGSRLKHQDYVANIFALVAYDGALDLKAPSLRQMYAEFDNDRMDEILAASAAIGDALNVLEEVNALTAGSITQKWIFVDLMWLVMRRHAQGVVVSPERLAASYQAFERDRRQNGRELENLITGRNPSRQQRALYDYIIAFKSEGGRRDRVATRAAALDTLLHGVERI